MRSANPGPSNVPKGVSIFCVGRKSPVTCTLTAFGARSLNVTLLSGLISGDLICEPPQRACCADAQMPMSIAAAAMMNFFVICVLVYGPRDSVPGAPFFYCANVTGPVYLALIALLSIVMV